MDGEAGWWTTSGKIGHLPLARVMGVGRQQQQKINLVIMKRLIEMTRMRKVCLVVAFIDMDNKVYDE